MAGRLPYSEIESHPGKRLSKHLQGTADRVVTFTTLQDEEDLRRAIHVACLCHDVGKATSFFQRRLRGKDPVNRPEGNHAMFGALFAYWVCQNQELQGWSIPVALAVARHHGSLKSPQTVFGVFENPHLGATIELQSGDLRESGALRLLCEDVRLPDPITFLDGGWRECMKALQSVAEDFARPSTARQFAGLERKVRLVYSALLYADKKDAGNVLDAPIVSLLPDVVNNYAASQNWHPTLMNANRTRLRSKAVERLEEALNEGKRRFQLTAPTGSGKTLAAFAVATKILEHVGGEGRRIVYCLPFLSIIDQVVEEAQKVFGKECVLAHHHLAIPEDTENEGRSLGHTWNWYQSWDQKVVVCTFQGLLDCMFGTRNRDMLRRSALRGAVVVLDEIQSLPAEQWPVVRHVLDELSKDDCFIIAMSATNPGLLDEPELSDPSIQWPADRIIHFNDEAWNNEQIVSQLRLFEDHSRLAVVNTVRRAIEITDLLQGMKPENVYHLSTNITPHERRQRIEKEIAPRLKKREPIVVISTQLVEAGVDLDFDVGFREFAPFDSLIQCLGRINRSHDPARRGVLHVFDGERATSIYGDIRINETRKLNLTGEISETDLQEILTRYYEGLKKAVPSVEAEEFLKSLRRLEYDRGEHAVKRWSLIREDYPKQAIIVPLNDDCRAIIDSLKEVRGGDSFEAATKQKLLYRQLASYIVNVPITNVRSGLSRFMGENSPLVIEDGLLEELYDRKDGSSIGWKPRRRRQPVEDQLIGGSVAHE